MTCADPSTLLFSQPVPESDAAILIGYDPVNLRALITSGRLVLWIVHADGTNIRPPDQPGKSLMVLPVDRCTEEEQEQVLDLFFAKTPKHLPSVYVSRNLPVAQASGFQQAINLVGATLEMNQRARNTRQQDAFTWQYNLFRNLPDYTTRLLPDAWRGAMTGVPAFICGAGPSLDVSGPSLAHVARLGLVLAADSSLHKLSTLGVQADFAVSVDIAKLPAKCLPESCVPTRVLLSATSPREWSSAIPLAQRYYASCNQLTLDWLATLGLPKTQVAISENCGATAIELARFLGCAPICLFGMDRALTAEGPVQRHHDAVDESLYTNSGFHAGQRFPKIPGNFSPAVPTHVFGDWRALNRRLSHWPQDLVWVVTDRGARLNNTRVMRPEALALPPTTAAIKDRLSRLPEPIQPPAEARLRMAGQLAALGQKITGSISSFQRILERKGPPQLTEALRSFFASPETGQMLGAFSLKILPHLLPPIHPDVAHWRNWLDELETLGHAASESVFLHHQSHRPTAQASHTVHGPPFTAHFSRRPPTVAASVNRSTGTTGSFDIT